MENYSRIFFLIYQWSPNCIPANGCTESVDQGNDEKVKNFGKI
jgi:hypothetical protein